MKRQKLWDKTRVIVSTPQVIENDLLSDRVNLKDVSFIIFDEAHKLSWPSPRDRKSDRYKLAEELTGKTDALLLLTATPHSGKKWQFWKLVSLINPYLFEDEESIHPGKLQEIMIRRGKDGLKDIDGKPIFKRRFVETIPVQFGPEESALYRSLTNYVKNEYSLAYEQKKRTVGFAMVVLQKRMTSSIYAIQRSLENRIEGLKKLLAYLQVKNVAESEIKLTKEEERLFRDYYFDPSSLTDDEREKLERKILCLSSYDVEEEIRYEIDRVAELLELAKQIKYDSKAIELRKAVVDLLRANPKEKILIFTEYKDTLDYLQTTILKGYKTLAIHGDLDMDVRVDIEKKFRDSDINIMLATDAAGEGINLQFCHIMINYDLPWNPNRIDQRIGRLHRYGQKRDVHVYNLQVANTREGAIFIRLQEKVKIIEEQMGGKMSEVLGTLLENVDLQERIMRALAEDEEVEVTMKDIEEAMENNLKMWETVSNNFLMPLRDFDMEHAIKVVERSKNLALENRMTGKDIEAFVRHFVAVHEGKVENTKYKDIYRIITPQVLLGTKQVRERYPLVTFDKKVAFDRRDELKELEFVAFGHPLLEAILAYTKSRLFKGEVTAKRIGLDNSEAGVLFIYRLRYMDSKNNSIHEELLSVFMNVRGEYDSEASKVLLNALYDGYEELKEPDDSLVLKVAKLMELADAKVHELGERKRHDVVARREKQYRILRADLERYFNRRITDTKWRLTEYLQRQLQGEDMSISMERARFDLSRLEDEYAQQMKDIKSQREVYLPKAELVGVCVVE